VEPLTIALPKGRMQDDIFDLLAAAGYPVRPEVVNSRRLIFEDDSGTLRFIMAKPTDVAIFVEYGAADLGAVGVDVLREWPRDVYEPLGLGVGYCRLVLAGPPESRKRNLRLEANPRVASKYPRLTREYFQRQGISAEIIPLSGSVELAPAVGLTDLLVDLVQTGRTLVENGLVEIETILESQAMLVVNRASHRLRANDVQRLVRELADVVAQRKEGMNA
jgi:ATP phosphoribosyltransferase